MTTVSLLDPSPYCIAKCIYIHITCEGLVLRLCMCLYTHEQCNLTGSSQTGYARLDCPSLVTLHTFSAFFLHTFHFHAHTSLLPPLTRHIPPHPPLQLQAPRLGKNRVSYCEKLDPSGGTRSEKQCTSTPLLSCQSVPTDSTGGRGRRR